MNKNKSLKTNLVLNYIRTISTIIFPLITYPYAQRVLLTVGMGRVKFVSSVMVYLQLIATLGISNYAIREGSKYRDNKEEFSNIARDFIAINFISLIVSYVLLFFLLFIPRVKPYKTELVIYSSILFLSVIGVDWIYSIYEDFFYITVRALVFQVVSLILLFLLVRDKDDVNVYLLITVISAAGSSLFNVIHSRKYVKWYPIKEHIHIKKHIKPILIMFGMTLATKIYLNMDTIMITMIKGDHFSGLYGAAIQINLALSVAITAISGVTLPRLSIYLSQNKWDDYNKLVRTSMNYLMFATVPTIIGLIFVTKPFIILYSGKAFVDASVTMKIILPNLFCSIMNGFIAYQIFMPLKKEKWALYGALIGAVVNFTFNSLMIPIWSQNGAAVATVITELTIFAFFIIKGKDVIDFKAVFSGVWKYFVAAISYPVVYYFLIKLGMPENVILIMCQILLGTAVYILLLLILKCEFVFLVLGELTKMWRKIKVGKSNNNDGNV